MPDLSTLPQGAQMSSFSCRGHKHGSSHGSEVPRALPKQVQTTTWRPARLSVSLTDSQAPPWPVKDTMLMPFEPAFEPLDSWSGERGGTACPMLPSTNHSSSLLVSTPAPTQLAQDPNAF